MGSRLQQRTSRSVKDVDQSAKQGYAPKQATGLELTQRSLTQRDSLPPAPPAKPSFLGLSSELSASPPSQLVVHPKLVIGAPGDRYEQEADRVAAQVVQHMHSPTTINTSPEKPIVQRKSVAQPTGAPPGGLEAPNEVAEGIVAARGRGRPLDKQVRQPIEQALGADFSGVRVHTDSRADQLNNSLTARAFTTGQDLFFKHGAYQPEDQQSQELIAHELTHVLQQKHTSGSGQPQSIQRDDDDDWDIDKKKTIDDSLEIESIKQALKTEIDFRSAQKKANPRLLEESKGKYAKIKPSHHFYKGSGITSFSGLFPKTLVKDDKRIGFESKEYSPEVEILDWYRGEEIFYLVKLRNDTYIVPGGKEGIEGREGSLDFLRDESGFKVVSEPLFREDEPPSAEHVKQTTLGDCYLQAALAAIAAKNPGYIKDMMRDNRESGEVTVRLYQKAGDTFSPKYVKVVKSVPVGKEGEKIYNSGALWVLMVQKAYAAGAGQLQLI